LTKRPSPGSAAAAATPNWQTLTRRYEQYIVLAREAAQTGDRVQAENLYQHAEHFYRAATLQKDGQQQ